MIKLPKLDLKEFNNNKQEVQNDSDDKGKSTKYNNHIRLRNHYLKSILDYKI